MIPKYGPHDMDAICCLLVCNDDARQCSHMSMRIMGHHPLFIISSHEHPDLGGFAFSAAWHVLAKALVSKFMSMERGIVKRRSFSAIGRVATRPRPIPGIFSNDKLGSIQPPFSVNQARNARSSSSTICVREHTQRGYAGSKTGRIKLAMLQQKISGVGRRPKDQRHESGSNTTIG